VRPPLKLLRPDAWATAAGGSVVLAGGAGDDEDEDVDEGGGKFGMGAVGGMIDTLVGDLLGVISAGSLGTGTDRLAGAGCSSSERTRTATTASTATTAPVAAASLRRMWQSPRPLPVV
jgi:hypothetical protein